MKRFALAIGLTLPILSQVMADQSVVDQPPVLVAEAVPARGAALLPLQRLVMAALARSPGTREAEANWRAAVQDVEQSKAGLWPKVEVSANTASANLDNGGAPGLRGGVGAMASYTLIDFGRTRQQIDARTHQATSLQARILLAREGTTFETVQAYMQLQKYQRMIRIYELHIVELEDLVGKLSEIVTVFVGRASELTQAKTRLGQAKDALNTLRARQREAQLSLLRQVGPMATGVEAQERLPQFPLDAMEAVMAQAREHHPAMASARAEAESALALAEEAKAARDPQVELQLAKQSGKDTLGRSYPVQLYVSAKWAAFQGFGDKAAEQALRERASAAQERMGQLQIELDFNVQSAWAEYQAQSTRLADLKALVKGTDQVRQDYQVQWRDLGKRSLLDVLTAENEHLNTLLSLASSEVDQSLALARMRYEAGGLKSWLVGGDGQAVAASDAAASWAVRAQVEEVRTAEKAPQEMMPPSRVAVSPWVAPASGIPLQEDDGTGAQHEPMLAQADGWPGQEQ
jgi:outer membrane protein, adhesin transport system